MPDPVGSKPMQPVAPHELRIALAMRGGVSLAVWIGGVVAEIDVLRHAFDANMEPSQSDESDDVVRARRNAASAIGPF